MNEESPQPESQEEQKKETKQTILMIGAPLLIAVLAIGIFIKRQSLIGDQDSKSASNSGPMVEVKWNQLQKLDLETGRIPSELAQQIEKNQVKLPGFSVALQAGLKPTQKFLFVPNQSYCIHVPPPPANLQVLVETDKPYELEDLQGPLWLEGFLSLKDTTSKFGKASWHFQAAKVYPYVWEEEQKKKQ